MELMTIDLFLGGSCNPTTWRRDIAIPLLSGISFCNPQVDDWSPALVAVEALAKREAKALLFVIDGQTRAIASMIEAVSFAGQRRRVFVTVEEIPDGTIIDGQVITGRELKDLNRARAYLLDELRHFSNVSILPTIPEAVGAARQYILDMRQEKEW
jgi:hypothetical protein